MTSIPQNQTAPPRRRSFFRGLLEVVTYLALLTSVIGLAVTGGWAWLRHGKAGSLGGWFLWIHFAIAPAFIGALLLVTLFWSERSRFRTPNPRRGVFARSLFWLMLTLGFVAISAILVSMTPLVASEQQITLYWVHRYCAIGLTAVVIMFTLALLKPARRS